MPILGIVPIENFSELLYPALIVLPSSHTATEQMPNSLDPRPSGKSRTRLFESRHGEACPVLRDVTGYPLTMLRLPPVVVVVAGSLARDEFLDGGVGLGLTHVPGRVREYVDRRCALTCC